MFDRMFQLENNTLSSLHVDGMVSFAVDFKSVQRLILHWLSWLGTMVNRNVPAASFGIVGEE